MKLVDCEPKRTLTARVDLETYKRLKKILIDKEIGFQEWFERTVEAFLKKHDERS